MINKSYSVQPTIDQILGDPVVDQELQRAWKESKPFSVEVAFGQSGSKKCEQGGWIVWNRRTGLLGVVRAPAGSRDHLERLVEAHPVENGDRVVVAWFHTHPNTIQEGYKPEPSLADVVFTRLQAHVPGIVETHAGRKSIPYP